MRKDFRVCGKSDYKRTLTRRFWEGEELKGIILNSVSHSAATKKKKPRPKALEGTARLDCGQAMWMRVGNTGAVGSGRVQSEHVGEGGVNPKASLLVSQRSRV